MHVLLHRAAFYLALGLLALVLLAPAYAADPGATYQAIKQASLRGIPSMDVIVLPARADPGCLPPAE